MQAFPARPPNDLQAFRGAADTPLRFQQRATIVGLAARGWSLPAIARAVGISPCTVSIWCARYAACGDAGLADLLPPEAAEPAHHTTGDSSERSRSARGVRTAGRRG